MSPDAYTVTRRIERPRRGNDQAALFAVTFLPGDAGATFSTLPLSE